MVVSGGGTPPPAVVVAKVEKLAMVAEVVGIVFLLPFLSWSSSISSSN